MYYEKRNMAAVDSLCPKAREKFMLAYRDCNIHGLNFLVVQGYRSSFQQNLDYGKGRWLPGRIVTNAKGGWSLHQYRVAFDFAPEWQGKLHYEDAAAIAKIASIFKNHGWEWGGDWPGFKDSLHLQFTEGHDINWFRAGNLL